MSKRKSFFLKFDKVALILGFIVDTITISSILLVIKIPEVSINLSPIISPGLALALWVITGYIYLVLLHRYWESKDEFSNRTFGVFLSEDLIFKFKNPILLFPWLILIVILFWIAFAFDPSGGLAGGLGAILFIIFFVSFFAYAMSTDDDEEPVTEEEKGEIDKNWDFLIERINLKLKRNQWLTIHDLGEIADIWEISTSAMNYALTKYAFEFPEDVEYGYVHRREDDALISGRMPVLINLEMINDERYWYSTS